MNIRPHSVLQAKASSPTNTPRRVTEDEMALFLDAMGAGKPEPPQSGAELKSKLKQERRKEHLDRADGRAQVHAAGAGSFMATVAAETLKYPDGRWDLKALAAAALEAHGLVAEFPQDVLEQVAEIVAKARPAPGVQKLPDDAFKPWVRDLRHLNFLSVDNGTLWTEMDPKALADDPEANVSSKDIDQLQTAIQLPNGDIKVIIAVSDLDAYVKRGTPLDRFIDQNTTSVYTPDRVFNMVPEEIAEDLASLNPREERLATIVEYTVTPDGVLKDEDVYQGIVKSRTKLDYASVGAWLDGEVGPSPAMLEHEEWITDDLRIQAEASARLEKTNDEVDGAIEYATSEPKVKVKDGDVEGTYTRKRSDATEMIENFMITSNGVVSRFLRSRGFPTIERVMEEPRNWELLRALADSYDFELSKSPKPKSMRRFLDHIAEHHPADAEIISHRIIRMSGRSEYRAVAAKDEAPGHFPMGKKENTQVTATIRRGGDRIVMRSLKAAFAFQTPPYSLEELDRHAHNLNEKTQAAKSAERMAYNQAIASKLESRVGESFEGVVARIDDEGIRVRIGDPIVEGTLASIEEVYENQRITVKLDKLKVETGELDFLQTREQK